MEELNVKLSELKEAGKIDEFRILVDILGICLNQRNNDIYIFFDKFMKAWREYLKFDDTPSIDLKKQFGKALQIIFLFIRKTSDKDRFNKFFPIFEEFNDLIEDDNNKISIYNSFGYLLKIQQKFDPAIKFSKLSLELLNKNGDILSYPGRYTNLGSIYIEKGDYKTAEKYFLQGLEFANTNNYQFAMHEALAALGILKMKTEQINEAIGYLIKALNLLDNNPQNGNFISIVGNIAACYATIQNHKKSMEYYNKLPLEWMHKKNPYYYYSILINNSINEYVLEKYDIAETHLLKAKKYAEEKNKITILLTSLINLGILFNRKREYDKAISYFQKVISIADEKIFARLLNDCYYNLANAYMNNEQLKQAIIYFRKSQKLSNELGHTNRIISILRKLSNCYFKIDQPTKAYITIMKYIKAKEKEEESHKEKEKKKEVSYEAGRSGQYKFSEGLSLISLEMNNKIGSQIIGKSLVMDSVIKKAFLASRSSEASVLILGESGTGKDLIAKLIHYASVRHTGPFVAVNSAVFCEGLVQSALFGHKKGAFTGASYDHIGYFEEANNGTIFLDEISEMPQDIQANLLRVLENKVIKRLGDNKNRKTDFRLVSASNKDIYSLIDENKFRFDLLNRINTIEIHIPPLRERKEDIPLLIEYFVNMISNKLKKKRPVISQAAINMLCDYDYPGNVRELNNIIERLILFGDSNKINKEDIFLVNSNQSNSSVKEELNNLNLEENENKLIAEALRRTNNVQVEAAKLLGISPYALYRRLKKMNH